MPKKQTSVPWFQMPTNLFAEEKLEDMYYSEGVAGLGAYLIIIAELYSRRSHKMTRNSILRLHMHGFKQPRIRRVLEDYGLFNIDEKDCVTAAIDHCDIMQRLSDDEQMNERTDDES